GIGYETCKELAEEGYHVAAVARSEQPLKELANSYPNIYAIPTDLTKENEVDRLVTQLGGKFNTIDIL
ncbi:MAG: SDR family NAD(P)-dependent oxidoreductase, partial [Aliifodinibius sp.]|nr:SDR family oxidoreductase [Fodinibius sp.]NIV16059.1 SDR family NAD(P)-dependent oxidoreductase [Fodinibius sp.]NIY30021.1 SDR family NAD(P)-dependent oxidoreductase [Fodinibius sp.]